MRDDTAILANSEQLSPKLVGKLQAALDRLSPSVWGASYLAPHPKSSDFCYVLRLVRPDGQNVTTFHLHQAPAELSALAQLILDMRDQGDLD